MAVGASIIFMAPGLFSPVFVRSVWISQIPLSAVQSLGLSRNRILMVDGESRATRTAIRRRAGKGIVRPLRQPGLSWDSCRQGWQMPSVSLAVFNIFSASKPKRDRGKKFAIPAPDFLECFISATIGIANIFPCGLWRCIGIYGHAAQCGLTKYVNKYSRPGVIEPIIEPSAAVIPWRVATSFRIFGESNRHLCRNALGTPGCAAWACNRSC